MLYDVVECDSDSLLCLVKLLLLFSAGITAMAPTLQDLVDMESVRMKTKNLPRREKLFLL